MDAKITSCPGFSLLNSYIATQVCSEPSWGRDVGQLAGSAGEGAGVVVEKGLVWVAREGPRGEVGSQEDGEGRVEGERPHHDSSF